MAVFNKKGGSQGGSGPLRWLPVGSGFNLLRLMFQSPGSPGGPFKNPAYKSYIAKISNEPLDFLMPDRSIVSARCVWIISGGRPSQHGFHLVIIANGRENLQKLTGQEGVSSRHFSAELIADAARADAAERSNAPVPTRPVTIKAKAKPLSKPVDDFSDLSGESASAVEKAVLPDEPARPAPKKAQATDLGSDSAEDEFSASQPAAGKLASTDLSDLDGGGESLDFQKYESEKPKAAPAPEDDDFLSTPSEDELETSSAPSLIRSSVKVPQDTGFLSDLSDDPVMVQTGGRTWSLDDEAAAAKPQPASEPPVAGELLEPTEPELEVPAEPEIPAEEAVLPEEPEAPVAAEVPVAAADENPFGGEEPVLAAVSAPPVDAEPIPEDNPFEELDTKAAAAPEPTPAVAEDNPFEDLDAAPATAASVAVEPSGDGGSPAPESLAAVSAPVDDTPGWDFSDDHPAAPAPMAPVPEPVKAAEPEAAPAPEPESDEFSSAAPAAESSIFEEEKPEAPVAAAVSAPAPAPEAEEPVAMGDFSEEADQMAARVAGESDGGSLIEEPPAPVDVEPPAAAAPAAVEPPDGSIPADGGFDDEPMFADETEAALGEAEALTDPEQLFAKSREKQEPLPSAPVPAEDDNAFAHDDVAYLDGLPKDAATAGDIRSAHVRQLDGGTAPALNRFDELRSKGAPEAFDDEAVPVGDEVSNAEDIFGGESPKVTKLASSEFPEEAGNGQDKDSEAAADLRYTNFNTEEATAKAIAEADSIMSAEEFFSDEAQGAGAEAPEPAEAPVASEPAPEPEPVQASVPEIPAEPPAPVRPSGNWRLFTTEVSNELKGRAKQAKVLERAPDMLRFDLKVRVLWPGNDLTEGVLCVKDRAPSVYLSASDIRKIAPDAEVEF